MSVESKSKTWIIRILVWLRLMYYDYRCIVCYVTSLQRWNYLDKIVLYIFWPITVVLPEFKMTSRVGA